MGLRSLQAGDPLHGSLPGLALLYCRPGFEPPHGAALLGNPGISAMVRHHALLYADLGDPVGLLRDRQGSRLSTYWPYAVASDPAGLDADQVHEYSELMAQSQALIAGDVLEHVPYALMETEAALG